MKLPLLVLVSGLTAQSAVAQTTLGPWVEVTNHPQASGFPTSFNSNVQLPADGSLWNMLTGNSGRGYASAVLMSTSTGGSTWRQLSFSAKTFSSGGGAIPASGQLPGGFSAVDSLRAWTFVTDYALNVTTLWRTTTGPTGLAVAPAQPPIVGALYFFNATTGIIVRSNDSTIPAFCRTTDGGQSWQPVTNLPIPTGSALLGGTLLGNTAWLSFSNGTLLRSTDAGLSWMPLTPPVPLAAPSFRDAQHGLALQYVSYSSTDNSALYRTVDGGATWTPVTLAGPVQWGQLAAVPGSAGTYLAVGKPAANYGGFSTFRSSDDGLTWQGLGGNRNLRSVVASGPTNVWATTDNEASPVPSYVGGTLLRYAGSVLATGAPRPSASSAAYPNPTTGRVQLPATGLYQYATVYDAAGRPCRTVLLGPAESTLDLSSLGAGHYLLRLTGGTGTPQQQHLVVTP